MMVKQGVAGTLAFDVDAPLTGVQYAEFVKAGYSTAIRYIPRTPQLIRGNLTGAEIGAVLSAGLGLGVVQHVSEDNWTPTDELGSDYGSYAASYLSAIGYPQGGIAFLDLEMVNRAATSNQIIAYCTQWFSKVKAGGFLPALYVGWQTGLSSQQLYDLPFIVYWRGYNADIPVAKRGCCLLQKPQQTLNGITYDPSTVQEDALGGLPAWVYPS